MIVPGMASPFVTLVAAAGAGMFLTMVGAAVARLTGIWTGTVGAAPALGWGVFVALALPVQLLIGFTPLSTALLAGLALVAAIAVLARHLPGGDATRLPLWACALAALVALLPLAGLLPKVTDAGALLGPAASDHAKVAMIDAMTRLGLPAANPFFGFHGGRGVLSYYYLWHFGAAQLSLLTGISGWEADAAMTGVTAYASVLLMMGIAGRCHTAFDPTSRRGPATTIALVAVLALTGSLRPLLGATIGWDALGRVFADYRDLEGWMSQASWVPQHLAAANSALLVVVLLPGLATRRRATIPAVGLLAAAAFGSSAWIGGVTLAVVAAGVAVASVRRVAPAERRRFAVNAALAGVIAVAVALPLLIAESSTVAARGGGAPIGFHPYEVVGTWLPLMLRRAVDLPAFWLVLLPLDLPAIYPAGVATLVVLLRSAQRDLAIVDLALLALLGLGISWLLVSTIGNNDLGWRAMLPPTLVLLPLAAAGIARAIERRAWRLVGVAAVLVAISLPERIAVGSIVGRVSDDAGDFATAPKLWAAVRHYAGPADRVANNPLFLDDLTSFPVNISWALLANRSSCYAGWETAQVYVDLPKSAVRALDARFIRVFAGTGSTDDLLAMAGEYGCRVAVVTDADGAWTHDPFATSAYYRLAERADGWRLYVRR